MKFEEGKSYKFTKPTPCTEGARDGYPHVCTRAIPDGPNVHASFDYDESPTLMTVYTPEGMEEFEEVLPVRAAREFALVQECLIEAGNESNKLFGVDAGYLKDKTIEVLRIGAGENTETAVLMAIRSGALTSRDLAAFTAYTINEAYGKAKILATTPDSLTALMEALGLPR